MGKRRKKVQSPGSMMHPEWDEAGPPVSLSEDDGVLLLRNPGLFRPGQEAFCRRLAEAAVGQEEVRSVQISLGSGTCRVDFEPGRVDAAEMADHFAAAVQAAIEPGPRGATADGEAGGWTTLVMFPAAEAPSAWEVVREARGSLRMRDRRPGHDRGSPRRIARAVADLPGVSSSRVTFWGRDLDVRYDPALIGPTTIVAAAERALRAGLEPATADSHAEEAEEPGVARGLKRVWYLALAGGSFGMTLVGFLVPGIPTVPFLLATSFYLARSSPTLHRLLRRSWFFGPILADYEAHGGLSPTSRIKLIGLTLTLGLVMLVLLGPPFAVLVLMTIAISGSLYLIMRIPGIPRRRRGPGTSQPTLAGATA